MTLLTSRCKGPPPYSASPHHPSPSPRNISVVFIPVFYKREKQPTHLRLNSRTSNKNGRSHCSASTCLGRNQISSLCIALVFSCAPQGRASILRGIGKGMASGQGWGRGDSRSSSWTINLHHNLPYRGQISSGRADKTTNEQPPLSGRQPWRGARCPDGGISVICPWPVHRVARLVPCNSAPLICISRKQGKQ